MTTNNEAAGTSTVQDGDTQAPDQTAIDAAAATAAAEASAGDERSEEQKAADVAAKAEADEKARKARAQEKIDRTVKLAKTEAAKEREARHKIEIEKARVEGELEALKRQGGKAGDRPAKADPIEAAYAKQNPEPQVDEFETQEEYLKAVRGWDRGLVRFELEYKGKAAQETEAQAEKRRAIEELNEAVESQKAEGEEKYEDFLEVTRDLKFHPMAEAAVAFSELGEDIAYYLGSNPKEMARIDKLSPALQAKEIGRIETGLETGKIQIKKVTSAPPPAKTVQGNANPKTDWSKKGDDEWYKAKLQAKLNSA